MYGYNPYQQSGYGKYPPMNPQPQYNPSPYYSRAQQQSQVDDVLTDYSRKQQDYMQNNMKSGAALQEIEMILDAERRRAKELRSTMENDLESEKRMRIDFENKLIKLKEESQKREMYVNDLEYKLSSCEQENNGFVQENRAIKDEIHRLQEMYSARIRDLEDKCAMNKRQQLQQEERFDYDYNKMKNDYEQQIESISKEWEFRVKAAEEKTRNLNQVKSDLEQELRMMQDTLMKNRLEAEEELRETIARVQDEETRKYMSNIRNVEQKLRSCDEEREKLVKKTNELLRQLADKDRMLNQQQLETDQNFGRLKQEVSEYHNQLNHANMAREKLRSELQGRDAALQRMEAELMEMQKTGAKNRELQKQEIDQILSDNSQEKKQLEDIRDQQARKINDQSKVINQMEGEIERLRGEYERLCGMLQNNINRSIYQTMSETQVNKFENQRPQFGPKY